MGHFSLDFKKAKGSSDARESDHIERKVIPDNADPTRTHLNRELVKMPSGVYGRDEAIAHRIKTAGIKRKITNDQVRVIRTVLSGTHEDMMNIAANDQLDDWCNDSLKWLQDTFGKEKVVSVVLHMDAPSWAMAAFSAGSATSLLCFRWRADSAQPASLC